MRRIFFSQNPAEVKRSGMVCQVLEGTSIPPFTLESRAGIHHPGSRVPLHPGGGMGFYPSPPKNEATIENQATCSLSSMWRVLTTASFSVTPSLDGALSLHETCFGPHCGRYHLQTTLTTSSSSKCTPPVSGSQSAWSRIECHIQLDLRTGKNYCSGAHAPPPAQGLRAHTAWRAQEMEAHLANGSPIPPSVSAVLLLCRGTVSMCKLASGHFSLKVCLRSPWTRRRQRPHCSGKREPLARCCGVSGGYSYSGVQLANQLLEIERIPASPPDVWMG